MASFFHDWTVLRGDEIKKQLSREVTLEKEMMHDNYNWSKYLCNRKIIEWFCFFAFFSFLSFFLSFLLLFISRELPSMSCWYQYYNSLGNQTCFSSSLSRDLHENERNCRLDLDWEQLNKCQKTLASILRRLAIVKVQVILVKLTRIIVQYQTIAVI